MAIRIQVRRGTASQWTTADPVLAVGEIGFETNTGKFKIGIGTTSWTNLEYAFGTIDKLNVTGISTLGVTSTTNLTSQTLNVSGISTLGITSTTNLTSQELNVSGIATLTQISAGGTVGTAGSVLSSTGSGLSWSPPASVLSISTSTSSTPQFITFVSSASTTSIGIAASNLTFIPSSDSLGIGTTNPTSKLHVIGNANITGVITATTFVGALTGTASSTSNIPNLTGAITSNNTTTSLGSFSSSDLSTALSDKTGTGFNVFDTSPTLVTPVLGAASATSIVVSSGSTFTNGPILVGTATSTGTASQPLQVTGGAYVSGNLGIAVTAPSFTADIAGDARVTSTNKMRFGGTSTSTNFYIQYNSTTNSLDFVAG